VAAALFTMFATVLNARALPVREFGVLVLFQSATLMISTITSFATQQPVIKLGAAALADGDNERLGRIIGFGLLLDFLAAAIATLLAFGFLAVAGKWLGLEDDQYGIAALFAASLLFSGYQTSNGIFRLLNRFGLLAMIQATSAVAILIATSRLYLAGASFRSFCLAWAFYYALNGLLPLISALWLVRRARVPVRFATREMHREEHSTFLSYCWTTWGMATADALRSNGDSLLVGSLVSVELAGIYNVAKQLAGIFRKFNNIYASAAFPEISALSAQGEVKRAADVRRRMIWVGAAIGGAAICAALLFGVFVLGELFGPHFEAAYWPLVILTVAAAAQLISHTLSMYVQVYVGPQSLFRAYMLATAAFLIVVLPLTVAFATTGTALAQLLFALAFVYFCQARLRRASAA